MRIQDVRKIFIILFMTGFLAGIFYLNLFAKTYVMSMGIFNDYFLEQYSGVRLNTNDYIWYIARSRVIPIIFLAILACTKLKRAACIISILWTGFSAGLLLTTSVLKLGIKGIVLCFTGIIPHYICYIVAYLMVLLYMFQYPDIRWNHSKTVSLILFLLLGIITECYINPVLMDIFINTL